MNHQKINNIFPVRALFDTSQAPSVYIVKAFGISIIPIMLLAFILLSIFPEAQEPEYSTIGVSAYFGAVIFSPLVETLLLWGIILIISNFIKSTWGIAILSAFICGVFHSLLAPMWGVIIFWSFVVFSISFIEWRKISKKSAFFITMSIHMCQNLFGLVLINLL